MKDSWYVTKQGKHQLRYNGVIATVQPWGKLWKWQIEGKHYRNMNGCMYSVDDAKDVVNRLLRLKTV